MANRRLGPLKNNENLRAMFTCRGQSKVSKDLALQYDKKLYLLEDNEEDLRSRRSYWIRIPLWQQATGTHSADDKVSSV
ncbi:hypothetical protein [Escherichia coli]|uniref:hypothetical protein n=1 Tax=Escherichia coli TaxID=562 RepID=UPI0013021065|nr:hypothetical protein [Escherichia coli]KAE9666530.1 hypothetical protein GP722_21395 [Escherichia coli]